MPLSTIFNPEPTIHKGDAYVLGIMTIRTDGSEKFIPVCSCRTFEDLREQLTKVKNIDTSHVKDIRSAYWEAFPADVAAAIC